MGAVGCHFMRLASWLKHGWIGRFTLCAYSFTFAFAEVYDGHASRDFLFCLGYFAGSVELDTSGFEGFVCMLLVVGIYDP